MKELLSSSVTSSSQDILEENIPSPKTSDLLEDSIAILSSPERTEPEIINLSDTEADKLKTNAISVPSTPIQRRRKLRKKNTRHNYDKVNRVFDKYQKLQEKSKTDNHSGPAHLNFMVSKPGSFGELLLKKHRKQLSENVESDKNEDEVLNSDEEEELELKRIALESVVRNMDKASKNLHEDKDAENLLDEIEILAQELKEPVDMDISDSEIDESDPNHLGEVGEPIDISVNLTASFPQSDPSQYYNNSSIFDNQSHALNLNLQNMESTFPVDIQGFYPYVVPDNHTTAANELIKKFYGEPLPFSSHIHPFNNNGNIPLDNANFESLSSSKDTNSKEDFQYEVPNNKRVWSNLIQVPTTSLKKSPQKKSRKARKRKRAVEGNNNTKFMKIEYGHGKLLPQLVNSSQTDESNVDDEESALRTKLLNDMTKKALDNRALQSELDLSTQSIQPTTSIVGLPDLNVSATISNTPQTSTNSGVNSTLSSKSISFTQSIATPHTVSNSSTTLPVLPLDNNPIMQKKLTVSNQSRLFKIGNLQFAYPDPIIINPNSESSDEEDCNITSYISQFVRSIKDGTNASSQASFIFLVPAIS